jgi:hypothetical protein
VEGGAPFLLALLGLAALVAPAALRSVWGIGLLSVWVHCLVEYPLQQRPAIGAWFFVLLGLLGQTVGRTIVSCSLSLRRSQFHENIGRR